MIVISLGKWSRTLVNVVQKFRERKQQEEEFLKQNENFLQEISRAKRDLEIAHNNYNFAENSAMLECCIYEIKAAESRLDYCIRQAKKEGISCDFLMAEAAGGERFL